MDHRLEMPVEYERRTIVIDGRTYVARRRRQVKGFSYYYRPPPPRNYLQPVAASPEFNSRAAADDTRANKRARVAASTEAIQGLPEVTPSSKLLQAECAVCLEDFDAEDRLRAMPCAHAFHEHCIFEWLRRNATCPLCRCPLPPTQGKKDEEASCNQLDTPAPEDP